MENKISNERIYKFDNIKFLAILLVVVGHVISPYVGKSDMFKSLFIFIYTFHMPLFIFISGLFQKRFSDTNKLKLNKVTFYVALGFLLKLYVYVARVIADVKPRVNIFGDSNISWFMFVMAMFMVTAYLTRKVHPAVMLCVSLALGCVSGYFDFIDDTLYLSRFLVYLPFYLLGYYMTPQLLIKIEKHFVSKIVSGLSMLLYFIMCFRNLDFVYQLRRLFTGKNPFSTLPFENCGFQHRLLCYLISALMCLAVFCFIPNIKVPIISKMGANTLSVYFWHNPLIELLSATPFFAFMFDFGDPMYKILLLTFALLLTLILSLNIFMVPLKALSKLIDKLKPLWCYVIIFAPFLIGAIFECKEFFIHLKTFFNKTNA